MKIGISRLTCLISKAFRAISLEIIDQVLENLAMCIRREDVVYLDNRGTFSSQVDSRFSIYVRYHWRDLSSKGYFAAVKVALYIASIG